MPAETTVKFNPDTDQLNNSSNSVEFDFDQWFAETCSKESLARYCRNREQHLNCRLRRGVAKLLKKLRAPNGHLPIRSTPITKVTVDDLTGRPRGSYVCVLCNTTITVTAKMAQGKFIQWVNSNIIRHMDEVHPSFWSSREIVEKTGIKEMEVIKKSIEKNEVSNQMICSNVNQPQQNNNEVEIDEDETIFFESDQTIQEFIINFECY